MTARELLTVAALMIVIAMPPALTVLVMSAKTKPPPRCYWHLLEQGPANKWVLVCDGPPPKRSAP